MICNCSKVPTNGQTNNHALVRRLLLRVFGKYLLYYYESKQKTERSMGFHIHVGKWIKQETNLSDSG